MAPLPGYATPALPMVTFVPSLAPFSAAWERHRTPTPSPDSQKHICSHSNWKGIHTEWSLGQPLCSVLWEVFWSSSMAWIRFGAPLIKVWPVDRQHQHPWVSLEGRNAGCSPDLWNQSQHLNKIPRWSMCTLKLDKHCSETLCLGMLINLKSPHWIFKYWQDPQIKYFR